MKYYALLAVAVLFSPPLLAASEEKISLDFCHISNFSEEVLCGSHTVEENRKQPNGRTIDIKIAVIPAVSEAKEPDPFVLFAGGPGQGARSMGRFVNMSFREVNENRDIVLIDQRGMGDSSPLSCDMPDMDFSDMDSDTMMEIYQDIIRECASDIDADVTQYTQDIANEDIHEIQDNEEGRSLAGRHDDSRGRPGLGRKHHRRILPRMANAVRIRQADGHLRERNGRRHQLGQLRIRRQDVGRNGLGRF